MRAARRRRLGLILVIVGPVMMLAGVVGLVLGGDDASGTRASTVDSEIPEAGTEGSATSAETMSAGPSDPGSAPVESTATVPTGSEVRVFVADFAAAIRSGEGSFLFDRLHPAVLERYGVEQCRRRIAEIRDETHMIEIVEIHEPRPWDYLTDGVVTTIEDALAVRVRRSSQDQQAEQDIHLAPHEGQVRWFTDCGDP